MRSLLFGTMLAAMASAATYEVGPGKQFTNIGDAPWVGLKPGDTILIYWRPDAYHEKWCIGANGTADAPVTVRGVPGPNGELPVIDGVNATTASYFDFWNEERSVIKVGGSSIPPIPLPTYIVIDGLEVRGAKLPNQFSTRGSTRNYADNAASIHIEVGDHITVRNCILHDSGNGLFGSGTNLLIEANYIYDNGYVGSSQHHNTYTESIGITYQYNRFGPTKGFSVGDTEGNSLKDRSAGLTVRYNWIEGGNRELDLVESSVPSIYQDPSYQQTFVYGNILIDYAGGDNAQILQYGGDTPGAQFRYRNGTLYFYNNTIVSFRNDIAILMFISGPTATIDARNNVFQVPDPNCAVSIAEKHGTASFGNNWWRSDARVIHPDDSFDGTIMDLGGNINGFDPGFNDTANLDFTLTSTSPLIGAGAGLSDAVAALFTIDTQYVKHQSSVPRTNLTSAGMDIGAFGQPVVPAIMNNN